MEKKTFQICFTDSDKCFNETYVASFETLFFLLEEVGRTLSEIFLVAFCKIRR